MIIGIDHIALSTEDIDEAINVIMDWGYKPKFINKHLPNSAAKGPYLMVVDKYHDISYCLPSVSGLAIELIAHGKKFAGMGDSPFKVIFSGKKPRIDKSRVPSKGEDSNICRILLEVFGNDALPIWLSDFGTLCYYLNEDANLTSRCFSIKCILLESKDLEKTSEFWGNLGFTVKKNSNAQAKVNWRLLEFKSYLPAWSLNLLLVNTDNKRKEIYRMDMPGFTCLALLTNNISKEIQRLKDNQIDTSEIFLMEAGDNLLKICLFSGPDGECVELIQVDKRGKK